MARSVLIVDDESAILTLLRFHLEREGFLVISAENGNEALAAAHRESPDLVILDLMLPGISGLEVLKRLRLSSQVPVIMLTAAKDEVDRVVGLEMGADDYITKPFSTRELVARVKALFRRQDALPASDELSYQGLLLRFDQRTATLNGRAIHMTYKEFDILAILMQHAGRVFSRENLFKMVWGYESAHDTRTINVHIYNLREKLDEAGSLIETVRGVGYRFRSQ